MGGGNSKSDVVKADAPKVVTQTGFAQPIEMKAPSGPSSKP